MDFSALPLPLDTLMVIVGAIIFVLVVVLVIGSDDE